MLGISESALLKLKNEFMTTQNAEEEEEEEEEYRPPRLPSQSKLGPLAKSKRRSSSLGLPSTASVIPEPQPVSKRPERLSIKFSEQVDSEIRFQFHTLLAEKMYPPTVNLLESHHQSYHDFLVQSETILRRHLHRMGFSYNSTTKVKIPFDNVSFVVQRVKFFRKMHELREANTLAFFHDETWINSGAQKASIWMESDGKGTIRDNEGKGNRIVISAMMNSDGIHLPTVDILSCSKDYSENSEYFLKWIKKGAFCRHDDNGMIYFFLPHLLP